MREQLIQYVDLIFAGTRDSDDIKQEILQNTLDRYDDLIAEGKAPEAAYRLAIMGIGDINEILGTVPAAPHYAPPVSHPQKDEDTPEMKKKRAIAIALYILCPVPLIMLGSIGGDIFAVFGVCCMLALIAYATYLMVVNSPKDEEEHKKETDPEPLRAIKKAISTLALVLFLVVSFYTQAWYITWLIFPIAAAVKELLRAIWDLKEEKKYET